MLVAYFAKAPQVRRGCRNVSAFPKDRFNQNRGDFFGMYLLGKNQVELVERFLDHLFLRR